MFKDDTLENALPLPEDSMEQLIETAHEIISMANQAVDQVGGSDVDLIEVLGMALGLAAGRLGFSRGGMAEILLDWYDQGTEEREEHLANPDIEVNLEDSYTISPVFKKGAN